jgi:hypothetical protein
MVWVWCLSASAVVQTAHAAVTEDWLYTVQQPVIDQSEERRQAAARDALLEVLSRVTGLNIIPRSPTINTALARPDQFYSEYVFARSAVDAETPGAEALALQISFQADAILGLVRQAELPIWWSGRPMSLAWVVVERDGQRQIFRDGSDLELSAALLYQARRRGLPLALPLLDLQDTMQVSPGVVWGNFLPTLAAATDRYGIQQLMVGRMRAETLGPDTVFSGDWQVLFAGDLAPVTNNFSGLTASQVANLGVALAANYFAPPMTIFSGDQFEHELRVEGVAKIAQYARMMDYFREFEFVDDVSVSSVGNGNMNLTVSTSASQKLLLSLLTRDGQLQNTTESIAGTDIQLQWRD